MTRAHDRDARPACPKCGVTRVHRVTWTIRSQRGELKFAALGRRRGNATARVRVAARRECGGGDPRRVT